MTARWRRRRRVRALVASGRVTVLSWPIGPGDGGVHAVVLDGRPLTVRLRGAVWSCSCGRITDGTAGPCEHVDAVLAHHAATR